VRFTGEELGGGDKSSGITIKKLILYKL